MFVRNKDEIESQLTAWQDEIASLEKAIAGLKPLQADFKDLQAVSSEVGTMIAKFGHSEAVKKHIVKRLNLECKLAFEDGKKKIYITCSFGTDCITLGNGIDTIVSRGGGSLLPVAALRASR